VDDRNYAVAAAVVVAADFDFDSDFGNSVSRHYSGQERKNHHEHFDEVRFHDVAVVVDQQDHLDSLLVVQHQVHDSPSTGSFARQSLPMDS
jgi:hypothetical protein